MAMIAKYTPASLLTALRMLGTCIPRCVAFIYCICAMMRTKTAMSKGKGGWFNSKNRGGG